MRNPWGGLTPLPREVWVISLANLVNRMGTMVLPFLILYLTKTLSFSEGTAGAMLAVYGVTSLAASPLSGALADRIGARRVMQLSIVLTGVVVLLYPLARTVAQVTAATIAFSMVNELYRPASLALISVAAPRDMRKQAFSLSRLAINLGMSVGPALGGFLFPVDPRLLFVVDGLTSLAAAAVLLRGLTSDVRGGAAMRGASGAASATAWGDLPFLLFLAAVIPVSVTFFQHVSSMPLFMVDDLKLGARTYGLMFTLNTLLIVAVEVPLSSATAHWTSRRTLIAGALLVGAGFGLLAFAHGAAVVAVSTIVWTFGEMILLPGMSNHVAEISPDDRRGEYMGLYSMAFGVTFAAGPWLGVAVLHHLGPAVLWGGCFAMAAVSAAMMAAGPRRSAQATTNQTPLA